jgi:hypothetical protein
MNVQGKEAGISLNFSLRLTQNPKPAVKFHATEIFLTSDNRVTTQEIARVLGNAKVHGPVHKSPSLGSVLSQIKAVHLTVFKTVWHHPHIQDTVTLYRFTYQDCVR